MPEQFNRVVAFSLVLVVFLGSCAPVENEITTTPTPLVNATPTSTFTPARIPETISIEDSPLKTAIIESGDYLVRQQIANGELSYQVNIITGDRGYSPSHIRLIAGTGSLYTVCRVSGDSKFCEAGDQALDHYLDLLVSDPERFTGTCLYTNGGCPLGGAALTIDAIYKRWQASGDLILGDNNLLTTAIDLGYFIVSMRRADGGFYHSFDPHYGGGPDENYFVTYFPGESLYALLELHEMTGNSFWLEQAREVNEYMITQPVTEDHWHSYAFAMFAKLDKLNKDSLDYARQIGKTVIEGQIRSLNPVNTSISTATKVESLASLAQAFYLSGEDYEWLDRDMHTFITFVRARQLPDNNCNFGIDDDMMLKYGGGILSSCDDPSIRIDGVQHWINGVTAFLEYETLAGIK